MKIEREMNVQERMDLHGDNPEEIMKVFLKEIITLDYSNSGIGKAMAVMYDILY